MVALMERMILLGAPGSGKGTQAAPLSERFHVCHISTGDIFREAVAEQTPLGEKVKGYLERGELVPDDLVIDVVTYHLDHHDCCDGFVLDGFPRSVAQAKALDEVLAARGEKLDAVIFIQVGTYTLIKRLSARRTCKECGEGYNLITKPPRVPGICDTCGGELYQRTDDKEETIQNRLEVYLSQTAPLIEYYDKAGVLLRVNGEVGIDEITASIMGALA